MEYQEKITDTLLKYGTEPKVPFGNVEVMTSEHLSSPPGFSGVRVARS